MSHPVSSKAASASKRDYTLLPWDALEWVTRALEYGVQKHVRDGWRHVVNAEHEYYKALLRHVASAMKGEEHDDESGLPTLAHLACNAIFLLGIKAQAGELTTVPPHGQYRETCNA